ncbi:hypothetical protein C8Q80DRAFT_1319051 [Daedaleopsis nitida]|nr:hypothetical protein C8Q80DRAFT_1319051 [Daedaleopsis nitida]
MKTSCVNCGSCSAAPPPRINCPGQDRSDAASSSHSAPSALGTAMPVIFPIIATLNVKCGPIDAGRRMTFFEVEDLLRHSNHITTLQIGPIPNHCLPSVDISGPSGILSQELPRLTKISLHVHYSEMHRQPGPLEVQEINLPGIKFPRLESLVLDGIYVPWTNPVFFKLKELSLLNYPADRPGIGFVDFLHGLSVCRQLQHLTINRYMEGLTSSNQAPPQTVIIPNLVTLELDGPAQHTARLLSHVFLPSATSVSVHVHSLQAITSATGALVPSFGSMLPQSTHQPLGFLPPQPHSLAVALTVGARQITLEGTPIRTDQPPRLVSLSASVDLHDPAIRARAYADALGSFSGGIGARLQPHLISALTIEGDFSLGGGVPAAGLARATSQRRKQPAPLTPSGAPQSRAGSRAQSGSASASASASVSAVNWSTVLSGLRVLRTLRIVDTGTSAPPESFARALTNCATCCPQLESVQLRGLLFDSWAFVDALEDSLRVRHASGGVQLQELVLERYRAVLPKVNAAAPPHLAGRPLGQAVTQVLARCAREVRVDIV